VQASNWSWAAFWATAAGVALGIPAGLLLDWLVKRPAAARSRRTDDRRRSETLPAIMVAIDTNRNAMARLEGIVDDQSVPVSSNLETASWEMVKADAQKLLGVDFRVPAALYFEDVRQLEVLLGMLADHSFGVNSAVGNSRRLAGELRVLVVQRAKTAKEKGDSLRGRLEVRGDAIIVGPSPVGPATAAST
jgi:hypothetical protein